MSDAAFPTGAFPGYTSVELREYIDLYLQGLATGMTDAKAVAMEDEIARRARVKHGDVSAMTPGERLRFNRK